MENAFIVIKLFFTGIGAMLGRLLGGWDGFLYALVVFTVIDYITGVIVAIIEKKLSSGRGFKGIPKKIAIFSLVTIGHVIDMYVLQKSGAIRTSVIFFYLTNEGISIFENIDKIGIPIPHKLKSILEQIGSEDIDDDR